MNFCFGTMSKNSVDEIIAALTSSEQAEINSNIIAVNTILTEMEVINSELLRKTDELHSISLKLDKAKVLAITFANNPALLVRAKEEAEAQRLREDAHLLEELGCFSIVLEKIPAQLAKEVSSGLKIPTIGIGAGNGCDGQVLVLHDMLGINKDFNPRFLRRYMNLFDDIQDATKRYIADVKSKDFPNEQEQY